MGRWCDDAEGHGIVFRIAHQGAQTAIVHDIFRKGIYRLVVYYRVLIGCGYTEVNGCDFVQTTVIHDIVLKGIITHETRVGHVGEVSEYIEGGDYTVRWIIQLHPFQLGADGISDGIRITIVDGYIPGARRVHFNREIIRTGKRLCISEDHIKFNTCNVTHIACANLIINAISEVVFIQRWCVGKRSVALNGDGPELRA